MQILNDHKIKYLNRRMIEIEELKESLLNEDYDVAISVGHRLKGNGETFGFSIISSLGIDMEKAALAKDKEKLSEIIKSLEMIVKDNLKKINLPNDLSNGHI